MKITKRQLRKIIKEEKAQILREQASVEASAIGSQHGGSSGIDDHHWPQDSEPDKIGPGRNFRYFSDRDEMISGFGTFNVYISSRST